MNKVDTLKRYKFSLAFENSDEEDYVTEKYFQSLVAGIYILLYNYLSCFGFLAAIVIIHEGNIYLLPWCVLDIASTYSLYISVLVAFSCPWKCLVTSHVNTFAMVAHVLYYNTNIFLS